ncbi:histidine phosphatase family protein [Actinopolymorpha alba]|uniref:histidine phosphatase family protein n=1 Tax=Actinopolymorpha alba TaxID=533267 RepID=UPI00039F83F7|nr:histidine phosphatase family protein [Actinopolymorpha alba]
MSTGSAAARGSATFAGSAVRIMYVRHGEDVATALRHLSHRAVEHPLTDNGREQAQRLAKTLATQGWQFDEEIITSPARSAWETAQILASTLGLRVLTDERLREIDVGSLDGRGDAEAWEAYIEIMRRWSAGEWSRRFPEGENLRNLASRLRGVLLGVAATAASRGSAIPNISTTRTPPTVLLVGHGGGFRAALPYLVANVADAYPHDDLAGCSVSLIQATPASRPSVLRLLGWGLTTSAVLER